MSAQKEYSALPNNSSAEPLLNADEFYYNNSQTQKGYRRHILRITHAIYLAAITAVLVFFLYTSKSSSYLDCTREANAWPPAISAILPYKDVFFNGTLDYLSKFRGPPSPSLDAAWETFVRMVSIMGFRLTEEEYARLGHPLTENTVRLTDAQGGGIFGGLEVYHQMHCLNLIRQYTYADYYQNRSITFTDPPDLIRTHVDHCIEMLRQKLNCDADVGVITHTWVKQRQTPWPDFNTRHRCRNFDAIREWSEKHNAPNIDAVLVRPSHIAGLDPPP